MVWKVEGFDGTAKLLGATPYSDGISVICVLISCIWSGNGGNYPFVCKNVSGNSGIPIANEYITITLSYL
jgi:hypothetical protein